MLFDRKVESILHVAVGAEIIAYAADASALTLEPLSSVSAPQAVQYAWPHPQLPLLYVAFSNRSALPGDHHHGVQVYRVDQKQGALSALGKPVSLPSRPIHITLDPSARFMLVAYNQPSSLTVHAVEEDGSIGAGIRQAVPVDAGIYAHQVRVAPSGNIVVLSARGNDASSTTAADPGALRVFRFQDGQLSPLGVVTQGTGLDYGPRHVDFHPDASWLYVSMERSNQLLAYQLEDHGVSPTPFFSGETTLHTAHSRAPVQYLGPIHLHPNGRNLYVVNRSDGTRDFDGTEVHAGGENSVACFSLDRSTGEPRLIQIVETQSFHCRTFAIHPGGRMLITAAVAPLAVREGEGTRVVPAGLTVFRVEDDGTLFFARKYDMETGGRQIFWCGITSLRG